MKIVINLIKTELKILFYSPVAWLILIVFSAQVGISFSSSFSSILLYQSLGSPLRTLSMSLIGGSTGIMNSMLSNLYLYIPLLTMGLVSKELNNGSIKLLYSSPISNFQIIISKYIAALIYGLLLISTLLITVIYTSFTVQNAEIAMMFTALLGVFLTTSAYISIGLFASTITRYPVVAAISTLAILGVLNFIGTVGQGINIVRDITYWIAINRRSLVFLDGVISTKELSYFLIINSVFIALSILSLRTKRLRRSSFKQILHILFVLVLAVVLGYISNKPKFTTYYDATSNKMNTLSIGSQEVMNKLKGKLTITSYSNFLDESWSSSSFASEIYDIKLFEKYVMFNPEIEMKYVYYYGKGTNRFIKNKYPNKSIKEIMNEQCKVYDINPKSFISEEDVMKLDDISSEKGRFVRVIKSANGKKVYLRKFKDSYINPSEADISSILKTLVDKSPIIGFTNENGERSCYDNSSKGYGFASDITLRKSFINQGYTVKEISLSSEIPNDVDLLIISDAKKEYSKSQLENYYKYIDRGGNLFILGEVNRQKYMNPLVEKLGLKFGDGIIVASTEQYADNLVASSFTIDSEHFSYSYPYYSSKGMKIVTPSAIPIEITENMGYKIIPMLRTEDKNIWIEKETTDFINEKSTINNKIGEIEGAQNIMLALIKKINEKEQRIFVIGDSDCISIAEVFKSRTGLGGSNSILIGDIISTLTYDKYPVDTRIQASLDTKLNVTKSSEMLMKIFFIFLVPIFLIIYAGILLIRRKRK